ncbi:ABC transporter ATP-binding protein [Microbacterium sp. G2-8]|uniref:ABC transporter ATP-binding protein n=1 Tax=Microbacterium sp. G2-8 TaxID=2842454 RepID=UPI001C8A2E9B|nr:ATP-binding cassette domain-containing protein [Microbacterium sp. G2-8]
MIEARELTKRYGSTTAVDDVSFTAKPYRVTGFLGPNGAGKSTTMRMLVGLARPDSGTARILGAPFADVPNPGRHVGVLLDASATHKGRTGRETLTLAAMTMGLGEGAVNRALDRVALSQREANRRTGGYSLGMQQRLGIAHALLADPAVLILDEPVNGLDPSGIRWMRTLVREFADSGGTVLLSSHLLPEIDAVADDIIIMGGGRVHAHGSRDELVGEGSLEDLFFATTADVSREEVGA